MTEREKVARAIGYLEGLSAFLWSIPDSNDCPSICPEACAYYDDQVELIRKHVFCNDCDKRGCVE